MDNKDQKVIDLLKKYGSNVTQRHETTFYLYFPSKDRAKTVASKISKLSKIFTVKVRKLDSQHLCLVEAKIVPEATFLRRIGKSFDTIAKKFQGNYDGWETKTELKENPQI